MSASPAPRHILLRMLAWLGGHERGVLLAAAAVISGIYVFALIANEVTEGDTQTFDRRILLALRDPVTLKPAGSPMVREAARDITALGGFSVLGILTIITCGYLGLDGKRRMALFVGASVLSGLIASNLLKNAFQRPRPDLVPHEVYVMTASFPSGHSMMSAITYLTLGALLARSQERRRIKAYILLTAALLTFLIGVTRVYLGVHWPTDVLAGWTAGAVWALICWLAAQYLQTHRALEGEAEHTPPVLD